MTAKSILSTSPRRSDNDNNKNEKKVRCRRRRVVEALGRVQQGCAPLSKVKHPSYINYVNRDEMRRGKRGVSGFCELRWNGEVEKLLHDGRVREDLSLIATLD